MPNKLDELDSLVRCFDEEGDKFDAGCRSDDIPYYISKCNEINSYKHVCSVRNWQWWDLDIEEQYMKKIAHSEQHACLIKADSVINDQAGRFNEGDCVRSSLLLHFHQNCIFETRNTFYLLVGNGSRKSVDPKIVQAIF